MTHEQEVALVRELGELKDRYSMFDDSEENKAIGKRIKEIRSELGLHSEPKKDRRPCRYIPR